MISRLALVPLALAPALLCGCSPWSTAARVGMRVVGRGLESQETDKVAEQLIGHPSSDADALLGPRQDVLSDVNGSRQWLVYPVPNDVAGLGRNRYVVETTPQQVTGVEMVQKNSSETDIPLRLIYQEKVKGRPPAECEAKLNFGPPLVVVRSRNTGEVSRVYDARLIKELSSPHYCVLTFDGAGNCSRVDFVEVEASRGSTP